MRERFCRRNLREAFVARHRRQKGATRAMSMLGCVGPRWLLQLCLGVGVVLLPSHNVHAVLPPDPLYCDVGALRIVLFEPTGDRSVGDAVDTSSIASRTDALLKAALRGRRDLDIRVERAGGGPIYGVPRDRRDTLYIFVRIAILDAKSEAGSGQVGVVVMDGMRPPAPARRWAPMLFVAQAAAADVEERAMDALRQLLDRHVVKTPLAQSEPEVRVGQDAAGPCKF